MKRSLEQAVMAGLAVVCAAVMTAWAPMCGARAGAEQDVVSALRANGAEVISLGSRGGLDGYFVTSADGAGYGLYLTADGHAVAGLLYGPDGAEITGGQLAAARPETSRAGRGGAQLAETTGAASVTAHAASDSPGEVSSPPSQGVSLSRAALFERSANAFGFTLGARGPLVVLFGDALCEWSRSAAARLGREALAGRLQLRVVPVAVLGAAAARRAAGIAASPDPARAWFGEARHPADRLGGERIARNNALFDEWGASAVPLIAWRARNGAVGHRVGDIDDVGAWLRETLGPETLVPDTLRVGDGP